MKQKVFTDRSTFRSSGRRFGRQCLMTLALVVGQTAFLGIATAADDGTGFYAGVGVAATHGYASASGSLSESEWDTAATLRVNLGYAARVFQDVSLGAEIYDYPTHADLGLGDQATQTFGVAVLPGYWVLPDTEVFVSLGWERTQTNSPVAQWRDFDTRLPVFGAGLSHSFAHSLGFPLSLTARIEQADYERLTHLAQTDEFRQTRLVLAAEFHF